MFSMGVVYLPWVCCREYSSRFKSEETKFFCLRVMVGVIILYDHVHPVGAFAKTSSIEVGICSPPPEKDTHNARHIQHIMHTNTQAFLTVCDPPPPPPSPLTKKDTHNTRHIQHIMHTNTQAILTVCVTPPPPPPPPRKKENLVGGGGGAHKFWSLPVLMPIFSDRVVPDNNSAMKLNKESKHITGF